MEVAPREPSPEDFVREVRAQAAFEHMIVSVLAAAAATGAGLALLNTVALLAKGAWSLAAGIDAILGALLGAAITFLIGFFSSIVVGAPLFVFLEKAKHRRTWPFFVAATAVSYAAVWIIFGQAPGIAAPAGLVFLVPGFIAAIVFSLRLRPLWRAAERAAPKSTAIVTRLH